MFKSVVFNGKQFLNVPADLASLKLIGFSNADAQLKLSEYVQEQRHLLIIESREAAYKAESDPLYMEWQYDQTEDAEQAWRDKVTEIKQRYPLPTE